MAYSALKCVARNTTRSLVKYELGKISSSWQNTTSRSLWCLCRKVENASPLSNSLCEQGKFCTNIHREINKYIHTKGDQELVQFLNEEIVTETKNQKLPTLPKIQGFDIKTDGSEVILTKKFQSENITVKFNVNHTVDSDSSELDPSQGDKAGKDELKSKPNFTVEVEKKGNVLGFSCSFIQNIEPAEMEDDEEYRDAFNIEEIVIHQGEWKDNTYSVSGEILDGYLYDLMMNYLEERGISSEFADNLINFSTSYEHKLYISLLENLKAFINGDVPKVMDNKVSHQQK